MLIDVLLWIVVVIVLVVLVVIVTQLTTDEDFEVRHLFFEERRF